MCGWPATFLPCPPNRLIPFAETTVLVGVHGGGGADRGRGRWPTVCSGRKRRHGLRAVTRLPMLPPPSRWSAGRAPASAPLVPKPWPKRSSGLGKRAPRPMRSSESTASQRDINRRLESEWLSREKVSHAWRCTLSFSSTWCFCAFISRASLCTTPLNPYVCTQKKLLTGHSHFAVLTLAHLRAPSPTTSAEAEGGGTSRSL